MCQEELKMCEEINFQHYVEAVKRKEITLNIFTDLIEDFSYSDINRLKNFNEILLMELTMNFSDLDRMKYLNAILLKEFKNSILKIEHIVDEDPLKIEDDHNSRFAHDDNDSESILADSKIQMAPIKEDILLSEFNNEECKSEIH